MKARLAIVCEGGLVQSVVSDRPDLFAEIEVVVIDYDSEGADHDEISLVKQSDGTWSEAIVHGEDVDRATIEIPDPANPERPARPDEE